MTSYISNALRRATTPFARVSNSYKAFMERHKDRTIGKWALYWRGLSADYREVAKDVVADCKQRPIRASLITTGVGLVIVAINTNPTVDSLSSQLIESQNRLSLVSSHLKNKTTESHINFLLRCYNEGLIRRLSLGLFSLIWIDNYDRAVALYAAQCPYLKPQYLTFNRRIVDVGAFDMWYGLEYKMTNYDVNDEEWQ